MMNGFNLKTNVSGGGCNYSHFTYEEFKETFSIENIRRLVRNNVKSFGGDFRRAFNSEFKWVNVKNASLE